MKRILSIKAYVRFWDDAIVNGKEDNETNPEIPCYVYSSLHEEKYWNPIIDVNTGIIINWDKSKNISAYVNYKVCDMCEIDYFEDDKLICNNETYRYCPRFLSPDENNFGDYITMHIDTNGKIKNWNINMVDEWINNRPKLNIEKSSNNDSENLSNKFDEFIKLMTPENNENYVDELDRNYDLNSKDKIWLTGSKEIGFHGETLSSMMSTIKEIMDEAIKEHPQLTYKDFGISTEVGYCYEDNFGQLSIDYEWLETDEEYKSRMKRLDNEKEYEREKIINDIHNFERKYNLKFVI